MSYEKIKLGIIFHQDILSGGGFQQAVNASLVATKIDKNISEIAFYSTKRVGVQRLINHGINSKYININLFKKILLYFKTTYRFRILYRLISVFFNYNFFESFLKKEKIDFVYFISPSRFALDLNTINYIFTVWDNCHRDHPEFPEVRHENEFEEREFRLKKALKKATAIIAESEFGKNNLLKRYNLDNERINIIPLEPAPIINLGQKEKYEFKHNFKKLNLNDKFIFYPAQFWPHKNHKYIIDGLKILTDNFNTSINAVFCGSDKGYKKSIRNYAALNNLEKNIIFTDFLSDEEVTSLYLNAIALVMPTYFGPTNMPPYEAFKLGTPVLYPEILAKQDDIYNAILPIKYEDPNTMALHINDLIKNKLTREKYINKGFQKIEFLENIDRVEILNKIIINFRNKFFCFKDY